METEYSSYLGLTEKRAGWLVAWLREKIRAHNRLPGVKMPINKSISCLVTRVGGWGEAWGGGPWRAGKGGDGGGAPESSAKGALVPCFGLP